MTLLQKLKIKLFGKERYRAEVKKLKRGDLSRNVGRGCYCYRISDMKLINDPSFPTPVFTDEPIIIYRKVN